MRRKAVGGVLGGVAALAVLAGLVVEASLDGGFEDLFGGAIATAPSPGAQYPEVSDLDAAAMLETLDVKGRAPKTGYDRTGEFGDAWIDVDRNGCDTRNDVLQRDLADFTLEGRCKVMTGTLDDWYTGERIDFVRGQETSQAVQIDHLVALSDAWQKGAQQLASDDRIGLANDPLNLLAVDGPTNSAKGDGDAATWLPPEKGFRCEYVARQISVKAAYGLWVTPAERDAMSEVLEACPDQPAYETEFGPAPSL